MPKAKTVRIASGSMIAPFSSIWRIVADRNEVFIGASKYAMGVFKVSLHSSGVWALAATTQSGASFEGGNRRAKKWNRPLEHAQGVTRGPSILIPHTSIGAHKIISGETTKKIHWYRPPGPGETVEFSLYFVKPTARTSWALDETVIDSLRLSGGGQLVILASCRASPKPFLETVENLLRDNVFRFNKVDDYKGGTFLWIAESRDALKIPLLIDMPVAAGTK